MKLRAARPDEATLLSELALRSKGHWGYDAEFLDACRAELVDVFVEPEHIGRGVGTQLWRHAVDTAAALGINRLTIDADPFGEPFYLAMGAVRAGTVPSGSIPGRELPRLIYDTLET